MAADDIRYAGFPSAVVYQNPVEGKNKGDKAIQHLMWGDWIKLKGGEKGDWLEVHARGHDGWMHKDFIQDYHLLEFVFVDVGQGDGCIITTPEDKQIIVDAGQEDNMYRFLKWRFGKFKKKFTFQSAIITHPDQDHCNGFSKFFDDENVWFENVFHNGIFPRDVKSDSDSLGQVMDVGNDKFLTDIIRDKADLERLSSKKPYSKMMKKALNSGRVADIKMLSKDIGYLPGYGSEETLNMQILGPVLESDIQNNPRLRWFSDSGKTKNGHSVILKIKYGNVRVFIGGDLNSESEQFLLKYYTKLEPPKPPADDANFLEAARKVFESDVFKSCHHGSSDFKSLLLKAVNPVATVISSGDNEPYSHPRADALGAIGKFSRGERPLIFSTELARSPSENIKSTSELKKEQKKSDTVETKSQEDEKKTIKDNSKLDKKINRSIAVYGAINVRTDGKYIMVAQKIEKPRSKDKEWDIYILEPNSDVGFLYQSKYR